MTPLEFLILLLVAGVSTDFVELPRLSCVDEVKHDFENLDKEWTRSMTNEATYAQVSHSSSHCRCRHKPCRRRNRAGLRT